MIFASGCFSNKSLIMGGCADGGAVFLAKHFACNSALTTVFSLFLVQQGLRGTVTWGVFP